MAIVEINRNPSRRDLLVFTAIVPLFFGIVGALRWNRGAHNTAMTLWCVGLTLTLILLVAPASRRWIYVGWMYATFPIAWTVSHTILGVIYFGVASPIALLLRVIGRDPMQRTFEKEKKSYWVVRQPNRDAARYFRQF